VLEVAVLLLLALQKPVHERREPAKWSTTPPSCIPLLQATFILYVDSSLDLTRTPVHTTLEGIAFSAVQSQVCNKVQFGPTPDFLLAIFLH
jgi:hypothetical protein